MIGGHRPELNPSAARYAGRLASRLVAVLPHEGTYSVMYGPFPVPVGSGYRSGYLARPDKAGVFPAVVLVPDLDGITAHVKSVARRLARLGLVVAAVDVYSAAAGEALARYHGLDDRDVVAVLDETQEFLASDDIDWAHGDRVGVLGLDVGGRFGLIQMAYRSWVAAAALVDTPLTGDEERRFPVAAMLSHLPRPVLGLYGAKDELIDSSTVDEAQARNATGTWLLYDGVGHGFMNESAPGYDPSAAEDALVRLAQFFRDLLPARLEEILG
jgi:carboxymethylenebutenolidase